MIQLKDALESLYELNELRLRAKELREAARLALIDIKNIKNTSDQPYFVEMKDDGTTPSEGWITTGEGVEVALLAKVQNHRDLSDSNEENNASEATKDLKDTLADLDLDKLFPTPTDSSAESHTEVPVLEAARSMQALVMRSNSVFSKATMLCYYRIVRELYTAAGPDWTVGAARAGAGGRTSAFITGECVRAIFAFEDAMKRTANFFQHTDRLVERYERLKGMMSVLDGQGKGHRSKGQNSSLGKWIQATLERMWFDWYISTNPRHGNIALHCGDHENELLYNPSRPVDLESVGEYLNSLLAKLGEAVNKAKADIESAENRIDYYRTSVQGGFFKIVQDQSGYRRIPSTPLNDEQARQKYQRDLLNYDRAESAHRFGVSLISKARAEANDASALIDKTETDTGALKDTLKALRVQFKHISSGIHKVLEPAKKYIRTVLYRELAVKASFGKFDAAELVFAAGSIGAITGWQKSELLTKACEALIETLPENGRLETTRPFQSTTQGHRMIPIGCEMTRCLAQVLQKTGYKVDPKIVRRMLNIFDERPIKLNVKDKNDEKHRVGWNFEGSPNPDQPCVWVTAVSVLALDRLVRMINERINSITYEHFQVIHPRGGKGRLTLNDLVYSDIGATTYSPTKHVPLGLRLEQMRAHVMRAGSPNVYTSQNQKERFFSAILYGPPGTGKTTLAEALALSSEVPLIRLSPSDLVLHGHSEIEGRARLVFEALSMLTQTVVILDEFEGVVGVGPVTAQGRNELEAFELLRRGMLPKLSRLYEAAKTQSLVYCLATNFLAKIDPAAKRLRRFDLHMSVYAADPLSRAGLLLYRLYRIERKVQPTGLLKKKNSGLLRRFLEVVRETRNIRANSLAEDYFRLPEWEERLDDPPDGFVKDIPLFAYIIAGETLKEYEYKLMRLEEERRETADQVDLPDPATETEQEEYAWLCACEMNLEALLRRSSVVTFDQVDQVLGSPSTTLIKKAKQDVSEKIRNREASATAARNSI